MGYIRHHAIIVTSYDSDLIEEAHYKAKKLFKNVSEICDSVMNAYYSFFIPPDGSKEGWEVSNEYDEKRDEFIEWCKSKEYSDGSNPLDYVELFYGDDSGYDGIIHASNRCVED